MKNIKYCKNKPDRTRSSVLMHTKTPNVTIQGNMTAMRYRNDVIRSVLLHIRANSVWCWHVITHHVTRLKAH